MQYILDRTVLFYHDRICWWDIIALVILIGMGVYYWLRIRKMKQQEQVLADRLAAQDAATAVQAEYDT